MITIKTTSGTIQVGTFLPEKQTAEFVLQEVADMWPHRNWLYVHDAETAVEFKRDQVIPDGTVVIVEGEQPVDA